MSYSRGFKKGYQQGFNAAFQMVLGKIGYSIEFAGVLRKKQLKMVTDELAIQNQAHKMPEPSCCYAEPLRDECGSKDILDNGQCEKHQAKCSCGKLATHGCSHAGQFVCGRPLCDDCRCNH